MRCTSPLYRLNDLGFNEGKFPSFYHNKRFYNYKDFLFLRDKYGLNEQFFTRINCGQCLSCRILYAKQWAERCVLEATMNVNNYFCTFTYDDEHLTYSKEFGVPVLVKKDMQDFFKRLRHSYTQVRYFGCGEYGDTTFRPHYHVIFFGLNLDDLKVYKIVKKGGNVIVYYNSEKLQNIWGKGFVVIGSVNQETCEYTARYSLKKIGFHKSASLVERATESLTDREYHDSLQARGLIQPCYSMSSRRPAIGRTYYDIFKNLIYSRDLIPGSKLNHLRYFDKLFEVDEPLEMLRVKEDRLKTLDISKSYQNTDYSEDEYYDVMRENANSKIRFRGN